MNIKDYNFLPVSDRENELGSLIVDIAFKIHRTIGPGLLESVYETCFCYELDSRGIYFEVQKPVPLIYEEIKIENGLRLDLVIEDNVIVELKAQENIHSVWEAQLLSYLKLTGKRLGYIINFHVPLMKDGIKRMIL